MDLNPKKIHLKEFEDGEIEFATQMHLFDRSDEDGDFNCFARFAKDSKKLVCFMPSALPSGKEKPDLVFQRWSWSYSIDANVIAVDDPTFAIPEIYCGWFLGRKQDLIRTTAEAVKRIARKLEVKSEDIFFYGSSMGGFSGLMMASLFENSTAIAEVPQLDLRDYPVKSALKAVETHCFGGESVADLWASKPELVSVLARFKNEKCIPNVWIITNTKDVEFSAPFELVKSLAADEQVFQKKGMVEISVYPEAIGHRPLPTAVGVRIINDALFRRALYVPEPAQEKKALDYKAVLDEAIELSKKIKYIRSPEDTAVYEKTIELLYLASTLNRSADWPLLRICSIEKLWSNSFNTRILDAATEAMSRRETLEGFIYCCRGYLFNNEKAAAAEAISQLMASVKDVQVANVGNIFKAIVKYDLGDYSAYTELINAFNKAKSDDFNPYIAIPVGTVYTDAVFAPADFNASQVAVSGRPLEVANLSASGRQYVISISCDKKYFGLYGKYIVKSFSKHCADQAVLHITFLDGDAAGYRTMLDSWGGHAIEFVVADIPTEVNKGPVASLLRFLNVSALLETYALPVLVLDLDTVIKRDFSELVTMMRSEEVDILSRVLENGMAPWEKYTGGFAFFATTENARTVARNIAYIGSKICRTDVTQWWIDQNVFEAGIRENLIRNGGLRVKNIYDIRDKFCVMPVGSSESKSYMLENALQTHAGDPAGCSAANG